MFTPGGSGEYAGASGDHMYLIFGWLVGQTGLSLRSKQKKKLMTKEMVLVVKMLVSLDVFNLEKKKKMSPSHIFFV